MSIDVIINEKIASLSDEKRGLLQHLFIHMVQVIANDQLQGFFFHTLPSPVESDIEPVLLHSINCEMDEVEEMMCNFIATRTAMAAEATSVDPNQRH